MSACLYVGRRGGVLSLWAAIEKCISVEMKVKAARMENTRYDRVRERGLSESCLLSQKLLKFHSPTLNKSTDHPSLPFFQVWGSYQRTPTPALPFAQSFFSLARIQTFFFFLLFLNRSELGRRVIASIFMKSWQREWVQVASPAINNTGISFDIIQIPLIFFHFLLCQNAQPPLIHPVIFFPLSLFFRPWPDFL